VSAASAVLVLWTSAAGAQECIASVRSPAALWSAAPDGPSTHPDAPFKIMTHLVCRSCSPQVSMELTAGPARPDMPLGQLRGMAWARAVYESPANREGFRQSVLRSELRSAPKVLKSLIKWAFLATALIPTHHGTHLPGPAYAPGEVARNRPQGQDRECRPLRGQRRRHRP